MAQIGLIGLAVMGKNLAKNIADHGYEVTVYNRTLSKVDDLLKEKTPSQKIIGAHSLEEFIRSLERPKKILLMVKAGSVVDEWIEKLLPFLEEGDILIDGGNSFYLDTVRRIKNLKEKKIYFIGMGISGGEEGARRGPSIMPGGDLYAWESIKEIFQNISAKIDSKPCCEWMGKEAAGHYVKMIHNGIEYVDMQLIAEAYDLLKQVGGCSYDELESIFTKWNEQELQSYLIEITAKIFKKKDFSDNTLLLENILDVAHQKGTGMWSARNALEMGLPFSAMTEAVMARSLSTKKEQREKASKLFVGPKKVIEVEKELFIEKVKNALLSAKIIAYAQGFLQIYAASKKFSWDIPLPSIAKIWQGGCIIRSAFLQKIEEGFEKSEKEPNILIVEYFKNLLNAHQQAFREVVSIGVLSGVPMPCFSACIAFYDGYRREKLSTNLIQAQRDFFGAHTFERVDKPRGELFHVKWE